MIKRKLGGKVVDCVVFQTYSFLFVQSMGFFAFESMLDCDFVGKRLSNSSILMCSRFSSATESKQGWVRLTLLNEET